MTKKNQKNFKLKDINLKKIFYNSLTPFLIHSDEVCLEANKAFFDLFDYKKEEIINKRLDFLFTTKSKEIIQKNIKKSYAKNYEIRGIKKDGTIIPVEVEGFLIDSEIPSVKFAIFRDISEIKNIEQFLTESEIQFRELFNFMSSGCAIYKSINNGENFAFVDINSSVEKIEGVKREEIVGKPVTKIFPGVIEFGLFDVFKEVYKTGVPQHFPISFYEDEKISGWRENFIYKLPSGKIVAIYDDVTKQKQAEEKLTLQNINLQAKEQELSATIEELSNAEEELAKTNEELLESNISLKKERDLAQAGEKLKSEFLATMSHEIRTPLFTIIGSTDLAMDSIENKEFNKNEIKSLLKIIQNSGENLLGIINDILDLSKISSNQIQLEKIPFPLSQIVKEVYESGKILLKKKEKNIKLTLTIDEDISEIIEGDPTKFKQIINNLLSNSIKFTEEGTINIKISIDANLLRIEVSDTGIGIPTNHLNTIFTSFKQGDSSISRKYGGTGLGLTIVKKTTELMNGKIEISSNTGENHGTKVSVILPYFPSSSKIKNREYSTPKLNSNEQKKLKILLAEDNPINSKIAQKLLERFGHTVITATNGREAIDFFQKENFDLIFMDIQMPEIDGLSATKKIRKIEINKNKEKTFIIAFTAGVTKEEITACFDAGVDDIIAKPVNMEKLQKFFTIF